MAIAQAAPISYTCQIPYDWQLMGPTIFSEPALETWFMSQMEQTKENVAHLVNYLMIAHLFIVRSRFNFLVSFVSTFTFLCMHLWA